MRRLFTTLIFQDTLKNNMIFHNKIVDFKRIQKNFETAMFCFVYYRYCILNKIIQERIWALNFSPASKKVFEHSHASTSQVNVLST